jgi:hypothetical protein
MSKIIEYISIFLIILITILAFSCTSSTERDDVPGQAPAIEWQRTVGTGFYITADCMDKTADGGYIVSGIAYDHIYLVKANETGDVIWKNNLADPWNIYQLIARQTSDNGYIVCGDTLISQYPARTGIVLIKTDDNGDMTWEKTIPDGSSYEDSRIRADAIKEIPGEGYIICGSKSDTIILRTTDLEGNVLLYRTYYDRTYKEYEFSYGSDIQHTGDDGFILCGNGGGFYLDSRRPLIIKINSKGTLQWQRTLEDSQYRESYAIWQTEDWGYILCVTGDPKGEESNGIWMVKIDAYGNELSNSLISFCKATGTDSTDDGGYIVSGYMESSPVESWLIKTDDMGNKLWDINIKNEYDTFIYSVKQTSDSGYIACGTIRYSDTENSDIILLKIAPEKKKSFSLFN